jgi:hypothetical protein
VSLLVKPVRLTRNKIKANRRNAQKSNGPKPRPGTVSKLAPPAILRAVVDDRLCPDYIRNALVALQEDPVQFSRHHRELIDEWQPSTPTLRKLVLRLAYLLWRQERAQRAQDGIMVCRMEKEVAERHQRMLESTSAPAQHFVGEVPDEGGLRQSPPSAAKFEQLLDWLQLLMNCLKAGDFSPQWETVLQQIYSSKPTLRSRAILEWARQLAAGLAHPAARSTPPLPEPCRAGDPGPAGPQAETKASPPPVPVPARTDNGEHPRLVGWNPPRQPLRSEAEKKEALRCLRRELAEEHRDVALEYRLYRSLNTEFPFYLRFSLCAPQDKYWGTAIYQELSLGQEIDRTLRLIVALKGRADATASPGPARGEAPWARGWGKAKTSKRGSARGLAGLQKLTSRGRKGHDGQEALRVPPPPAG